MRIGYCLEAAAGLRILRECNASSGKDIRRRSGRARGHLARTDSSRARCYTGFAVVIFSVRIAVGDPQATRFEDFEAMVDTGSTNTSLPASALRRLGVADRKSTRLNSSHDQLSYAVFCLK